MENHSNHKPTNQSAPIQDSSNPTAAGCVHTDIVVVGAGPVGLALTAWLLRDSPWHITLIDARPRSSFTASPAVETNTVTAHAIHPLQTRVSHPSSLTPDVSSHPTIHGQRMLALAAGSRMLLEDCAAWPLNGTPISTIHISQRHHFGRTLIRHSDYDLPALGYVVAYEDLLNGLSQVVFTHGQKGADRFQFFSSSQVTHIDAATPVSDSYPLTLTTQGLHAGALKAKLLIHAEGELFHQLINNKEAHKNTITPPYPKSHARDYQQTALLGTVTCNAARSNWAWERFTDEGPLALLPIKQNHALHTNAFSLVWVGSPTNCAQRMALSEKDFLNELNHVFGQRMGKFESITGRHSHALHLRAVPTVIHNRRVAIGNAAQTLHPVAGQGFNLGLRDAYLLAQALQTSLSETALVRYAQARQQDRTRVISLTDLLPRLFCTESSVLKHMLGLGLCALDLLPPARHVLAQQMMFGVRTPIKNA